MLDNPKVNKKPDSILNPGFELTLRPMKYPEFYKMFETAQKNTWTVGEVDFANDVDEMKTKIKPAEMHLIKRLVAFFATGDTIVSNNLALNLYKHINAPEARMYLSRQIFEEALHIQFYLTLLDAYIPDQAEREQAFSAIENIPSIKQKGDFCFKWMGSIEKLDRIENAADRRSFLLNLICFATCIEGLFFFAAFAYVYYLRSKGLLNGLATGTNWVFRDESMHMSFAFSVVETVRRQHPEMFDADLERDVGQMIDEAIACELDFAEDVLKEGIAGLSLVDMKEYLRFVGDNRLRMVGMAPRYGAKNPFGFMELQDVQGMTNFFERRVSDYASGVEGRVNFDDPDDF